MLDLPTDRISETDLADVLWRGPADVDILLAPPRIEMAEMVLIRDLEKTISLMRRLYDLVIVDTGVGLDELTLALLDQADTILEIVTYDATTIRNTIAMAETFQKIGYPPSKVQYLVNRADSSAGIDPNDLRHGARARARVQGPLRGPGRRAGEQPGRAVRDRRAGCGREPGRAPDRSLPRQPDGRGRRDVREHSRRRARCARRGVASAATLTSQEHQPG